MEMDQNPFAPPQTDAQTPFTASTSDAEAERIRYQFLNHEWSIRAIGVLYLFGACCMIAGVVAVLVSGGVFVGRWPVASGVWAFVVMILLTMLLAWIGWGLWRLNNAARIGGLVYGSLSVLAWLLQFNPVVLSVHVAFLYFLAGGKGRYVCSEEYRAIVRKTPHIKLKTSTIVIAVFVLILLLVGIAILAPLFAAPRSPIWP